MELLFGAPPQASDAERGVPEMGAPVYDLLSSSPAPFEKNNLEVKESKLLQRDLEFSPIPQLDDLSFLVRYVLLNKNSQIGAFDHIVDFVQSYQSDAPNFTALPDERKVIGYIFEDSKFACYNLQLFRHADTIGLSCDLQDGFAPALNSFWNGLHSSLIDAQYVAHSDDMTEDDEDDDLDFLDSDSEDGGFVLDLSAPSMHKYLNLKDNQTVIENWVQDIQDPNFSQQTLLTLSYNIQSESNLQVLVNNYAQDLFDSILASLSTMTAETLPSVRSACVFLAELAKFSNVKVTEENIKVLIDQLAKWTLSDKKTTEVMRSKEVATLLSECILPKYSELVSGVLKNIQTDVLQTISEKTDFDNVKFSVDKYRQVYAPPAQPVR